MVVQCIQRAKQAGIWCVVVAFEIVINALQLGIEESFQLVTFEGWSGMFDNIQCDNKITAMTHPGMQCRDKRDSEDVATPEARELLSIYEFVCEISWRMLDCARAHNWPQLIALEQDCAQRLLHLKAGTVAMSVDMKRHKIRLLQSILQNDREIRAIAEPDAERFGLIGNKVLPALIHN